MLQSSALPSSTSSTVDSSAAESKRYCLIMSTLLEYYGVYIL